MFLQYTKYRDIDAVTWHDACHVTNLPGSPSAFPSGGSTVKRGIIARKEGEPGNEATKVYPSAQGVSYTHARYYYTHNAHAHR